MRILIDECVDERLRNSFSEHDCQSVRYAGFAGLKNSDLLEAVELAHFDVLVTVDQGWEHEQNLARRYVAVVIFCAKSKSLEGLVATRSGVSQSNERGGNKPCSSVGVFS